MSIGLRVALIFLVLGIGGSFFSEAWAAEKQIGNKPVVRKNVGKAAANKSVAVKTKKQKTAQVPKSAQPIAKNPVPDHGKLSVKSGAALVMEQHPGGEVLFQKNASQIVPIASITKLMTAMVVLDSSPIFEAPITISDDDIDYLRGSHSRLPVGAVISRETALLLALMSSENRASHALARHYPNGKSAFLSAMNNKARELGMSDTHFKDPTGLNSDNVSTAIDLAKLVAAAHQYPLIREFTTTGEAKVEIAGQEMEYRNTNPLVRSSSWEVGLSKTGYISEAGKCLVMQARLAEKPVVIVLLDSVGSLTRVGDANRIKRWMDNIYTPPRQSLQTSAPQRSRRSPS